MAGLMVARGGRWPYTKLLLSELLAMFAFVLLD